MNGETPAKPAQSKHASRTQIIQAGHLLDKHCTTDGMATGYCRYLGGRNDEWIAKRVGVSIVTIRELRQEIKGKIKARGNPATLRPPFTSKANSALAKIVASMCDVVADLAEAMGEGETQARLHDLGNEARKLTQVGGNSGTSD